MTQVIIYTNENGNVSVCYPTGELPIEEVKAKDTPEGSLIVDSSILPKGTDEQFFNAWELHNGAISVNLDKAKNITKNRLREDRAPLFTAQDIAFQRALETGADTSAIVAEKQRLRDITNLADACSTTEELLALKVN